MELLRGPRKCFPGRKSVAVPKNYDEKWHSGLVPLTRGLQPVAYVP
jgi:hypothetical protein